MDISSSRQLENIFHRNRKGEEIYTKEYIDGINDSYKELLKNFHGHIYYITY